MNQTENKLFWDLRAKDKSLNDKSVTNNDIFRRELEIQSIINCLKQHDNIKNILEIGCGSGYGTKQWLVRNDINITATDYSSEMIELAKLNNNDSRISYKTKDVIALNETNTYDCVITQRCLINILDEKNQYISIKNIINSLKKGGILIFLEGIRNGRQNLNIDRVNFGLEKMPDVIFNLDFDKYSLLSFIETQNCEILQTNTLGTYDFISRVIYPSIIKPDQPMYDSNLNENIYKLLSDKNVDDTTFENYSRTMLVIARKK